MCATILRYPPSVNAVVETFGSGLRAGWRVVSLTVFLLFIWPSASPGRSGTAASPVAADDLLARSRVAHAALKSYADSGTVIEEQSGFVNRSMFRTRFRKPMNFYFEFKALESEYSEGYKIPLGTHLVFWMLNGGLETWNAELRSHEVIPAGAGNQIAAVTNAAASTNGTVALIPSLLFTESGLVGTLQEIGEFAVAGTITIEPQANPQLDDSKFRFTVPAGEQ